MSNRITHRRYPELPALHMSNGVTDIVYCALAMAAGLLATTPREVRLAQLLAEKDQNVGVTMGRGLVGYDLAELGWSAEDWPAQRRFLLRTIAFARASACWLFARDIHFAWLDDALAQLAAMVNVVDARIVGGEEGGAADTEPPVDDGFCPLHGCYLHELGCIVCTCFAPSDAPWMGDAIFDAPPDAPWRVAARDGIPVVRFERHMTRRSFSPSALAALRPKRGPWCTAYEHVLGAFAADPFGLIAATGDRDAYELEAYHYLSEWASGRPLTQVVLLGSILTTSFASAPRTPGRIGLVLAALERLDDALVGLAERTPASPPRRTLWPRTPASAILARVAPPPPAKGALALARAVVFPEVGDELIGFLRVGASWIDHVFIGALDASALITVRVTHPLGCARASFGEPHLAYPESGVDFGGTKMPLSAVSAWFSQTHVHLAVLGPGDRLLRVFQIPVGPASSASAADDPSGEAQLAAFAVGRIGGDAQATVDIVLGRVDYATNFAASMARDRSIAEATARSERAFLDELAPDAGVPQVVIDLLARLDRLLEEGRIDDVTSFAEVLSEEFGSDILVKLVVTHSELRGGANRNTHALALLWRILDPDDELV